VYLQWHTNTKSYTVYRTPPYSATLNDPYARFQDHAIIWCWISEKRHDIHSFNGIIGLIWTSARPTQHPTVTFRMTLSDLELAKYSMIRSLRQLSYREDYGAWWSSNGDSRWSKCIERGWRDIKSSCSMYIRSQNKIRVYTNIQCRYVLYV